MQSLADLVLLKILERQARKVKLRKIIPLNIKKVLIANTAMLTQVKVRLEEVLLQLENFQTCLAAQGTLSLTRSLQDRAPQQQIKTVSDLPKISF